MSDEATRVRNYVEACVAPEDFPDGGTGYRHAIDCMLRLAHWEGAKEHATIMVGPYYQGRIDRELKAARDAVNAIFMEARA